MLTHNLSAMTGSILSTICLPNSKYQSSLAFGLMPQDLAVAITLTNLEIYYDGESILIC
jgi:hypothetical protein